MLLRSWVKSAGYCTLGTSCCALGTRYLLVTMVKVLGAVRLLAARLLAARLLAAGLLAARLLVARLLNGDY